MSADDLPALPEPKVSRGWIAIVILGVLVIVVAVGSGAWALWRIGFIGAHGSKDAIPIFQNGLTAIASLAGAVLAGSTAIVAAVLQRGAQNALAAFAHKSALVLQQRNQASATAIEKQKTAAATTLEERKNELVYELEKHKTKLQQAFDLAKRRTEAYLMMTAAAHAYFRVLQRLATDEWDTEAAREAEQAIEKARGGALLADAADKKIFNGFLQVGYRITDQMKRPIKPDLRSLWLEEGRNLGKELSRWEEVAAAAVRRDPVEYINEDEETL